jgi:hypothetical protein
MCILRTSGCHPTRGGDDLLDDSLKLTAGEAIRLATALLKAAEDVRPPSV